MKKRIQTILLAVALAALNGTVAISQTAPGTFSNPIKGGATILQFSRLATDGLMSQGTVTYYQCGTMETQQVLGRVFNAALTPTGCDELPEIKGASLTGQWNQWIRVTPGVNGARYQGLHAAMLSLVDSTGLLIATLQCRGSNGVGTHRQPLSEACEACTQPMHFEGSFTGTVVGGVYKGAWLQGTYAGDLVADPVTSDQSQPFRFTMDGVVLKLCANRFTTGARSADAMKALGLSAAK